ncbi:hypothetical protein [Streptomyces sp. NPDC004728]|uniref:hypothetical protein n=1 Tax=Streptomyces sp. NPDC004728 TaxID=3154289 RepID=UPI0033AA510B
MKQLKRSAAAVLTAALLGGAGLASTVAPAHAARNPVVSTSAPSSPAAPLAASRTKYYVYFDYTSWSHWTPDSKASSHAGTLNKGRNYVYCYTNGENYTDNGHTSTVWLQTDDDSGNANVWVTRVYLSAADYNVALPHC